MSMSNINIIKILYKKNNYLSVFLITYLTKSVRCLQKAILFVIVRKKIITRNQLYHTIRRKQRKILQRNFLYGNKVLSYN